VQGQAETPLHFAFTILHRFNNPLYFKKLFIYLWTLYIKEAKGYTPPCPSCLFTAVAFSLKNDNYKGMRLIQFLI
jgi:hypothetical protein